MKPPSSEHPITISKLSMRLIVRFDGIVVAQSDNALMLEEASYPPVFYVPRSETYRLHFRRTGHSTHCPYKGQADYFNLIAFDRVQEHAVWTYEAPPAALIDIKGHVAFSDDHVTFQLDPL